MGRGLPARARRGPAADPPGEGRRRRSPRSAACSTSGITRARKFLVLSHSSRRPVAVPRRRSSRAPAERRVRRRARRGRAASACCPERRWRRRPRRTSGCSTPSAAGAASAPLEDDVPAYVVAHDTDARPDRRRPAAHAARAAPRPGHGPGQARALRRRRSSRSSKPPRNRPSGARRRRSAEFAAMERKWLILTSVSLGSLMATLDGSIVNIALPAIQ